MGNVDHTEYSRTPDWRVELTPKGREQARHAGEALRALNITGELLCVYSSPYMRCQQTLAAVLQGAGIDKGGLAFHRQEPRLREQDFGNFQDPASVARAKEERARFGRFFYRFPNGESGADVYDRVSTWLESLHRELEYGVAMSADSTVLLVTHGLTARLFLMRWYRWSVDTFEATENPGNAAILVMERDALGRYALTPDSLAVVGVGRKPRWAGCGRRATGSTTRRRRRSAQLARAVVAAGEFEGVGEERGKSRRVAHRRRVVDVPRFPSDLRWRIP